MDRLFSVFATLSFVGVPDSFTPLNVNEETVWELERSYYEYAKANDQDGYLSLFHENVIGWPAFDSAPKGKDKVHHWISEVHGNPGEVWGYELSRQAIQDFGDVVVVHYLLRDFTIRTDSREELRSDVFRISHTWQRTDNTWKIISGMGGRLSE